MQDENKDAQPPQDQQAEAKPEFGFGHPAHRPDPNASYGFQPQQSRVLPVRKDTRWRVPG